MVGATRFYRTIACMNEALQKSQIVLVSDPFTKDSDDLTEQKFVYKVEVISGNPA